MTMFLCYCCGNLSPTITVFRAHLYRHNGCAELKMPILCRQADCKASFANVYNFVRHVQKYHAADEFLQLKHINECDENANEVATGDSSHDSISDMHVIVSQSSSCDTKDYMSDILAEGVSLVAGLRANSSLPYCVIPKIVDSFNHMATSLTDYMSDASESSINEAGVDASAAEQFRQLMNSKLQSCQKPLDFLSTVYKQDKYFENHNLFVKPESVSFNSRFESHNGVDKLVYDSFQYVSVTQTIRSLLTNESYVSALQKDKCVPGVYQDYADGERAAYHPLFGNPNKFSLMIQLFYDGLGTANPLRGQAVVNNIGVFFYTIKNLPVNYNSCFANVHLLALCYSEDLKRYGFDPILNKFVDEVRLLQHEGIVVHLPNIGMSTIYASLCQVTCDNLALNSMLGFVESFSCDYFCTLCYATQESIQTTFRAENFQKRTVAEYDNDVSNISAAERQGRSHSRGVKHPCVLNNIDGYHVTENWCLDILHIVLEGIVTVELGCILYALCGDKVITVETLNAAVVTFWGKLSVNKCDKPPAINRVLDLGMGISPSMKAVQCWALLKYLPVIIGNLIPEGNVHWDFLLHLSHLVDLLFATRFTRGMVAYLRDVIEDHLTKYYDLWKVKLRPKHHLLVHLPDIILKSGPLVGMSCLKYEMKNSFFKRTAKTICNFRNVCFTLANRHQQRVLDSWLANDHIRDIIVVTNQFQVPLCSLAFCASVCQKFNIEATDDIAVTKKINVATVQYTVGNHIVLDCETESGMPIFGKIVLFVCSPTDDWYFVVESVQTVEFGYHYHAYVVDTVMPPAYSLVRVNELVDHHPLHCCELKIEGVDAKLIRLPYCVIKC